MSSDSIFRRMLRSGAMPHFDTIMRTPQPQRERWAALTSEIGRIRHAPLWIDDNADLTVADIRMRAKRLASELKRKNKELGLIIIDYLQLIQGSGKKNETRQQKVSEISMRLKALANTLNLPILLLSQIARVDRVDKRPLISDLRDFRSIEPVADVVALIHREGYYHHEDPAIKNLATLILAKQRNGPTGDITLNFLGQFVKFTNPPPSDTKASPRATTSPS